LCRDKKINDNAKSPIKVILTEKEQLSYDQLGWGITFEKNQFSPASSFYPLSAVD
jgi:hypothetical protein